MIVQSYFAASSMTNTYILIDEIKSQAILIDPVSLDQELFRMLQENGYTPMAAVLTSLQKRHVRGVTTLGRIWDISVYGGGEQFAGIAIDHVKSQSHFTIGSFSFAAHYIPGYRHDALVYIVEGMIFPGDLITAGQMPKALDTASNSLIAENLGQLFSEHPLFTPLFPSFGPPTTIGCELESNSYFNSSAKRFN